MRGLLFIIVGVAVYFLWQYFKSYPKLRIRDYSKDRAFLSVIELLLGDYLVKVSPQERPKLIDTSMAFDMIQPFLMALIDDASDKDRVEITKKQINNLAIGVNNEQSLVEICAYVMQKAYLYEITDADKERIALIITPSITDFFPDRVKREKWI